MWLHVDMETACTQGDAAPVERTAWRKEIRVALGYLALALVFQCALGWPWNPVGGSALGDRGANLWNLWWVAHAIVDLHQSPMWTGYVFAPDGIALYGHSLSLANGLLAIPLTRALGPVASYDLLFLVHTWLTGWGFHLWARRRTSGAGCVVVAVFAACGAFRLSHLMHLNLFSTGALGFALWAWDGTLERRKLRDGMLFTTAWLLTSFAAWYHGIAIGAYAALTLTIAVLRQKRSAYRPAAWFLAALLGHVLLVSLYMRNPNPERFAGPDTQGTALPVAAHWSNGPLDLISPPWISSRPLGSEWTFHPGLIALALAGAGVVARLRHRNSGNTELAERDVLACGMFFILSLGPVLLLRGAPILLPAWALMSLPGFENLRVYARFAWYGWLLLLPYAW